MTEPAQPDVPTAAGAPIRVFLNYRREDTGGHALHLYTDLVERFGDDSIFMDMRALEPGLDFEEAIEAALEKCDLVVCLIGPRWLTSVNSAGVRRLDDPDDWVRLELEAALARPGVRVIPVLVERAQMPARQELPERVAGLARRQAFELSNVHWANDVETLISLLDRVAQQKAERERLARAQASATQLEQERTERERAESAEAERLAAVEAERGRLAHVEAERVAAEEAERQRQAREQAERQRQEQEQAAREQAAREAERVRLAEEEDARRRAREAAGVPPPPAPPAQPSVQPGSSQQRSPTGLGPWFAAMSQRQKIVIGGSVTVGLIVLIAELVWLLLGSG